MKCRTCGTKIADKALICYRCGVATSDPLVTPPDERPRRGRWPVVLAILLLSAVSLLVLPQLAPGPPRLAGWAGVIVATVLIVWRLRPEPRRSRLLGRRR
jgi:hypothetical protein